MTLSFDNSYLSLPDRFYKKESPKPVLGPKLIKLNTLLAEDLGLPLDWLHSQDGLSMLSGNQFPQDAAAVSMAYAGHQFGHFNPSLGDGRALLLGEIVTSGKDRFDLHLKGSGPTQFSRGGDGRSPIGPVIREFILCEAMHALGVPTTRALAAVMTDEEVHRRGVSSGGVFTRVAKSHIRIGTFEYFAAKEDFEGLHKLLMFAAKRHYPEIIDANDLALAFIEKVTEAQALLISKWMLLGFIHGVMNTDNMLISGETIDYGPCAFMDDFSTRKVFSSIDRNGRYAFENQPKIAIWNLGCLLKALLPLFTSDESVALAQNKIHEFEKLFKQHYEIGLRKKIGLELKMSGDTELINELLAEMQNHDCDFTLTFRALSDEAAPDSKSHKVTSSLYPFPPKLTPWLTKWRERIKSEETSSKTRQEHMYKANPAVIPRNHLVENAIELADKEGNITFFNRMVKACETPYEYSPKLEEWARPPLANEIVHQTFCGT